MKNNSSLSKFVTLLLLTALIITSQFLEYHVSGPPAPTNPVKPCSYVIYIDVSTYVANNCTTGLDDYRSVDAYTVINGALSSLNPVGGLLHLRAGSYRLSTTLTVSQANATLQGEGYGTIITQPTAQNLGKLVRLTASFITLRNLRVDGNAANQISGEDLISIEAGGNDATVQGLWLTNAKGHALQIRAGVFRTRVLANHLSGVGNLGVHIYNPSLTRVDSLILDNYFVSFSGVGSQGSGWGFGVSVVNSQNVVIAGNTFVPGNGSHNEAINIDSSTSTVIQGNTIRNSFDSGIVLDTDSFGSTSFCTIIGNTVELSQLEGIVLTKTYGAGGVSNNIVSGNVVRNNGQKLGEVHYGIALGNAASNNTIIGNAIYDDQSVKTQSYGVYESGTPASTNRNTIVNNVFWGLKIGPVFLVGTNDVVRGNVGYNPVGVIASPFSSPNDQQPTVGLLNTLNTSPSPSKTYLVVIADLYIVSTGGSGVNISVIDSAGYPLASGLTEIRQPLFLAIGYKINFGSFTGTPSVNVFAN